MGSSFYTKTQVRANMFVTAFGCSNKFQFCRAFIFLKWFHNFDCVSYLCWFSFGCVFYHCSLLWLLFTHCCLNVCLTVLYDLTWLIIVYQELTVNSAAAKRGGEIVFHLSCCFVSLWGRFEFGLWSFCFSLWLFIIFRSPMTLQVLELVPVQK